MKQFLVASFLGSNNLKFLPTVTHSVVKHQCYVYKSRLLAMGEKLGLLLQIDGSWNQIVKLEVDLKKIATHFSMQLNLERSDDIAVPANVIPYVVELNAAENTTALEVLSKFLSDQGILIYEVNSGIYTANPIKLPMTNLQMHILIPDKLSLPDLRENFVNLCDALNIDAYLDPERG